jgi:hypothetical protein
MSQKRSVAKGQKTAWVPSTREEDILGPPTREEEILAKPDEKRTRAERKWVRELMGIIIKDEKRGRKKKTQYEDWDHARNRALFHGQTPPSVADLAGLTKPVEQEYSNEFEHVKAKDKHDEAVIRITDAFKKAKRLHSLPTPPRRSPSKQTK